MHSTIHAVCGQQKGQNRNKSHVWLIFKKKKKKISVKRAGRHFDFFKMPGRHEKGAGRRALQNKPRQNTGCGWGDVVDSVRLPCEKRQIVKTNRVC